MDAPPQAIVSGFLAGVLRVSRALGIAPLSFKKVRGGWRIRVSRTVYCFGVVIVPILSILSMLAMAILFTFAPLEQTRPRDITSNSTTIRYLSIPSRLTLFCDSVLVGSVTFTAAVTGLNRMKCFVEFLPQLRMINTILNKHRREAPNKISKFAMASVIVTFTSIFNTVTEFGLFVRDVLGIYSGKQILFGFWYIPGAILPVTILQFSRIAIYVLTSLQTFNKSMEDLLEIITEHAWDPTHHQESKSKIHNSKRVSKESINYTIDTMAMYSGTSSPSAKSFHEIVRRYISVYCYITDVVKRVNDTHGFMLVTVMMSLLLHLIITPYQAIMNITGQAVTGRIRPFLRFAWVLVHFGKLLMIIEPCHLTQQQMKYTKKLINKMMRVTPERDELFSELKIFYRHTVLNEIVYAPFQLFPLDRSLIIAILGCSLTYLIVLIKL